MVCPESQPTVTTIRPPSRQGRKALTVSTSGPSVLGTHSLGGILLLIAAWISGFLRAAIAKSFGKSHWENACELLGDNGGIGVADISSKAHPSDTQTHLCRFLWHAKIPGDHVISIAMSVQPLLLQDGE
jgi:hypothetical protein